MLTLGNRDVRKGLGVSNFGEEREMEDVELEEGEAYSYHDTNMNNEYSDCIDPDVSLSYIDAKIQHVLGHFQKDFEGVFSAENLGSKFGGYGSFLENGERSPVCDTPRLPPPSQLEDGSRNPVTPLSVPQTMKPRFAPVLSVSPSQKKAHAHGLVRQEGGLQPRMAVQHVNSNEREEIKSAKLSDPRMLKVRIKVGSDNLSTQKKAAIYSGLGLDLSPSTLVDCSPSESEGTLHKPQDILIESPMSILQIMTSPFVHKNLLLSPLPDDLILLTFKETLSEQRMDISNAGPCRVLTNESVPLRNKKVLERKLSDQKNRNDDIADVKRDHGMTSHHGTDASFDKNMEIDTMDCEEIVSKTLKLPVISSAGRTANLTKFTPNEVGSHFLEDKILNNPRNEGTPESPLNEDLDLSGKPKGYPGKLLQGNKATVDGPPTKTSIHPEVTYIECKTRSSSVVGNSGRSEECPAAIPSEVLDVRLSYPELDNLALPSRKEKLPSKGKVKLKGSRTDETLGADASRESLSGSSSATKSNKSVQLESSMPKSGRGDMKLVDSGKSRDRYKEFFGDSDGEEDNEDEPLEVAPAGGLQDCTGKGLSTENLERAKAGSKKIIKSLKPTVNAPLGQSFALDAKHDVNAAPIAPVAPAYMKEEVGDKCEEIGAPIALAVPLAPAAPVFIQDWVCCDKCQKWRLLPPGKNPNELPDKWLCSMLDWLLGMNRCSVSQEETTGAIMASLQVPFSDAQKSEHLNFGGAGADINALHQPVIKRTSFGPPPPSSRGTKKSETKGLSFSNEDGPQFSDSEKKQVQSSKRRSLDDVKPIPLRDVADFEKPINHDLLGEKHVHELKANENDSDRGDLRNSKPHKRREADRDNLKTSKKVKNELRQHDNEDWRSDDSKTSRRRFFGRSPGGWPTLTEKNLDLDEEGYLKMSKHESAKKIQVSLENMRGEGHVSSDRRSLDIGGSKEIDIAAKKRKSKDPQEARESLEGTIERHQGSNGVLSQDNEHRKNKKSRILKNEGKDPGIRLEGSKIDKKESEQIDQLLGLGNQSSRWGINDMDSVQRKTRSPMPAAAASSSSKVCSSPKSKSSFREMKGSPAESVSSSPVRSSKRDKQNLLPKIPMEKEECQVVKIVSPRKCHHGDIIAPNNNFWTDTQEESANAHDGFLGSSLVPDPDEIGFSANAKAKVRHSLDVRGQKGQKDSRESSGRDALVPTKSEDSDLCLNGTGVRNSHHASESHSKKSGKASSSRSRDRSQSSKHEGERDKPKHSFSKSKEAVSLREARYIEGKAELLEKVHDDGRGKCSSGEFGGKHGRVGQTIVNGLENKDDDLEALHGQSAVSQMDNKMKEYSTKPQYSKANQSAERQQPLPSSLPGVVDSAGTNKVNEAEPLASTFPGKSEGVDPTSKNRQQRHLVSNGNCARETDARSPIKKDALNVAANKAIKEGADLKHMADRVKDSGSNLNRTVLYFQAALKFLHGASLLESSKNDISKHYDIAQSVQVYGSTAKLCEYCAHEYEKSKDMASATLAYKCMEVAYLKVVYSSTSTASRDRVELQTAFKINPAGESPSSSASDLDNVNNSAAVEKSAPKGISSPYVPGSESIIAQSRNGLIRLFNFSQDVSSAMEASRRSHIAFSAASARTGDAQQTEGISFIRSALDFNFQDVQGLLRLVRLASEAIGQ